MADKQTGTQIGTGNDPLGRYPLGQAIVPPLEGDALADAVKREYVVVEDEKNVLAEAKATVHEPVTEANREVTDHPYDPDEAAAIDARNRQLYVEARRRRFERRAARRT